MKLNELREIIGDASVVTYHAYQTCDYLKSFDYESLTSIHHKLGEIYDILWDTWAIIAGMIDKDWRCLCLGISFDWEAQ